MSYYSVVITAYLPYPITFEYIEKATGFPAAVARAIRKYRKEPRIARRKIDNLIVKVGRGNA